VANAESLAERAGEVARQFAAIPRESFRLTKLNLRRSVLAFAGENAARAEAQEVWESPEIHERIRAYLERTIGKGREQ
jgi:enoyl-CoA hydratase/carnithine racemase